jgi:hypothetical protein
VSDPQLTRLYRESPRDEPSAELDSAVLAAAHREAHARPRRSFARAWGIPLSAAAVVVLSAALTLMILREPDSPLPPQSEQDVASRPSAPMQQRLNDASPDSSRKRTEDSREAGKRAEDAGEKKSNDPALAASDEPRVERRADTNVGSHDRAAPAPEREKETGITSARDAAKRAPQPASRAFEKPPEAWLAYIEKLRAEGKVGEAQASLAEFEKRYPAYPLPERAREAHAKIKKTPAEPGLQEEEGGKNGD